MNERLKSVVTGAAVLAIASGGLLAGASSAFAAASPWEPDPNSLGSVVFYDASGNVITGGNDLNHLASYYAVTTPQSVAGTNKATLYMAAPDHTKVTGLWFVQSQSAATTFPNAAAPPPLTGPGFVNPLVSAGALDGNLNSFLASATLDSTAGYANTIQIRVKDSGPGGIGSGTKYWETNISYTITDPVAGTGTWAVNDPGVQATTTTLTASPPSPQTNPAPAVTLMATVAPASSGTVKFMEGATQLGTTQPVVAGTASVNIGSPALGDHSYIAIFTPTGGTLVSGSTSSALPYHVGAPQITTTTDLGINPGTATQGSTITFTSNVAAADSSSTLSGTVQFKEGATVVASAGPHSVATPFVGTNTTLLVGTHNITATFVPADPAYSGSSSATLPVVITASPCPTGTCDQQTITADITAGTIVISTPYTAAAPLDVPLGLDNTASFYTGQAAFNGIHITDTRAGNLPWDLKAQASNLANGAAQDNGQNVGLTALAIDGGTPFTVSNAAGNLTVTNAPAATPVVTNPADPGTLGLGGAQHTLIHANAGLGTITYKGTLTINAPTNLPAGTYTGTITFTVG